MAWLNSDGLYLKYGTERATPSIGGENIVDGQMREITVEIDLTTLTATETILADNIFFPAGARVAEVKVVTHTAAATGTAIDLGLIAVSNRSTEVDYDGFLAAFPTASMNAAGETTTLVVGSTYAGALIGATNATVGHISASRTDATAFTAGVIYVTIRYYFP